MRCCGQLGVVVQGKVRTAEENKCFWDEDVRFD